MGSYNKTTKWIEGLSPESVRRLTNEIKARQKIKKEQKEANENISLMATKWKHKNIAKEINELFKS